MLNFLDKPFPDTGFTTEPLERLEHGRIFKALSANSQQQLERLEVLDSVDSTNNYAWAQENQGTFTCLAEYQWAGRGRQGRHWISPYGSGVCLSIKHRFTNAFQFSLGGLNIALAVSIVQMLKTLGIQGLGLKWPNDVIWGQRKLAGLLLESQSKKEVCEIVVGIGLNFKLLLIKPEVITQPWVDLYTIQSEPRISRNRLAAKLIDSCLETFALYATTGLTAFIPAWQQFDLIYGKKITLLDNQDHVIQGIASGIDEHGALWIKTSQGKQRFVSGEVQWLNW